FVGAESEARRFGHHHRRMVPALLQTRGYAEAIIVATALEPLPDDVVKARFEIRQQRQQHVLERAKPPAFTVIVDEAVLRRPVGGLDVMREQLEHLVRMARRESVNLVVLPFSAGPHPGLVGAFSLLEYEGSLNEDVLCLETASGDFVFKEQRELIEQYGRAADHLEQVGLA